MGNMTTKIYRQKTWKVKNPSKNREHQKKYRKTSEHWKQWAREWQKTYYWKNREKINARRRERHALRSIQA